MAAACHFTFRIFPYSIRHLWSHLSEGYPMVRLGIAFILAGVLGSGAEMLVRSYLNLQGELSTVGFYSSAYMLIITYTGMVAVSRIIVGAHFFSDVLMGGTIAFVSMIIFREIFICKGSNVKAMFGKE